MRTAVLAAFAALGLAVLPMTGQAAPAVPHETAASGTALTHVRGGCGPGWHPRAWQDRWGRWHRRCVPNRW